MVCAEIFRAYDIRGIVGKTLHENDMRSIGRALAQHIGRVQKVAAPRVAVARDGRLSSPALEKALVQGLQEGGAIPHLVGLGPTPMLYFAVHHLALDGGAMITGSHNPPDYNGIKMLCGTHALFGPDITALYDVIASDEHATLAQNAAPHEAVIHPIEEEYVASLHTALTPEARQLATVWDTGHGAGGEVAKKLAAFMEAPSSTLFSTIDGHFPAHHPDPSKAENLDDLQQAVQKQEAALGLAFDGDADRLGVVDHAGNIVPADQLLMLYASALLETHPGARILADVKTSQCVFDHIQAHGGVPEMTRTGHSLIKARMRACGALLAGEASGHVFFADTHPGYDDGFYAAIRLLNLVAASGRTLAELVAALPKAFTSQEWHIAIEESQKAPAIQALSSILEQEGATVNRLDGLRVQRPHGWWLLRASNTQAALIGRCEGATEQAATQLEQECAHYLQQVGLSLY